jgi:chorismate dehydratase
MACQRVCGRPYRPYNPSPLRFPMTAAPGPRTEPRDPMQHTSSPTLRVGAVSYLNSKPLIEGLAGRLDGELVLDYPSRLAELLEAGQLDVALVPVVEVLRSEGACEIVSDACVAARGPVRSVKLYFRVPPGEVKTLSLDEGSRTSAALARVLLRDRYGVEPDTEPLPLGRAASETTADAILLIGDRAMFPVEERFEAVWDLGEEWNLWTGLPFVFAVWAARRDTVPAGLAELLATVRDSGVANAERIARREAAALGLDPAVAVTYLTNNLHFTLGPAERSGLKLFGQLAYEAGLAPRGIDLVFRDRTVDEHDGDRQPGARPAGTTRPPRAVGARDLVGSR